MANDETESAPIRILVVDDDPDMQQTIVDYLENDGIKVLRAASGKEMLRHIKATSFTLIILDLRIGQEDGLELLRDLRRDSNVPVIVATAHRREEMDRVVGLELGADDYILKPFSLRELLARIRVLLRRPRSSDAKPNDAKGKRISRFEGWTFDRLRHRLTDPSGRHVPLTRGEYVLLLALVDAPGRPLSREFLLQATRLHEDIYDRSVDVQILRLRRKLEVDPTSPRIIRTERGLGYVLSVPVETED